MNSLIVISRLVSLIVFLAFSPWQGECAKRSVHFQLLTNLTDEYGSPTLRPVNNTTDVVLVGFRFAPVLTFLDETSQEFNVRGIYLLTWRDDRLAWNPTDYDGIREINVPLYEDGIGRPNIWKPELVVYERHCLTLQNPDYGFTYLLAVFSDNSYLTSAFLTGENPTSEPPCRILVARMIVALRRVSFETETQTVTVKNTGDVYWYTMATTKTDCSVVVRYYPFDDQTCHIRFTTWLYQTNEQLFYIVPDIIETNAYKSYEVKNGVWDVIVEDTKVGNASYECVSCKGEEQSYVHYTIKLRNAHQFLYFINFMLPCLVMSAMTLVVIWLPKTEISSAAGLGVTCILTFFVFLSYLFGQLPATGLPLLGDYIVWLIIETVLITIYALQRAAKEKKTSNKTGPPLKPKLGNNIVSKGGVDDCSAWPGESIKLTRQGKGSHNRVHTDEASGLQAPRNDEVSDEHTTKKVFRQGASTSSKDYPGEDVTTTKIYPKKQNLFQRVQKFWTEVTLKHAVVCMKAVTSLIFIGVFLHYICS